MGDIEKIIDEIAQINKMLSAMISKMK